MYINGPLAQSVERGANNVNNVFETPTDWISLFGLLSLFKKFTHIRSIKKCKIDVQLYQMVR